MTRTTPLLPHTCEHALLEQFLKAESMALRLVRAAQTQDIPQSAIRFLLQHEEEEHKHLKQFEELLGTTSQNTTLPRVPSRWCVLAVHLYGYEALGLEFASLLVGVRPDLLSILEDEQGHVRFFENEIRDNLLQEGPLAVETRCAAQAWRRRLPRTVDRYLHDRTLAPFRDELRQVILDAIDGRFAATGLVSAPDL